MYINFTIYLFFFALRQLTHTFMYSFRFFYFLAFDSDDVRIVNSIGNVVNDNSNN